MPAREKVFLGRDNSIRLGLVVDGTAYNAAILTRIVVRLVNAAGDVTIIDSNTAGNENVFDTTQSAQVSDTTTNILVIKLQDAAVPPTPGDDYTADLILYDSQNPDGVRWDAPFPVEVIAA